MDFLAIGFSRPILSMFLIYVAYLLFGSLCFVAIETVEEQKSSNESLATFLIAKEIVKTLKSANFSEDDIHDAFMYEKEIKKGSVLPDDPGWTRIYGDKMFFAFILISTVGYGNVTPTSTVGQVVCIIYTLFGLPIHVIMMRLLSFEYRNGLRRVFIFTQKFYPTSKFALVVSGIFFFIFGISFFIFVPAYIFTRSENWTYSRAVYFSFVSLTTIGLGDYVAGVSPEHFKDNLYSLTVVAMLFWMVFGLGFVSMAVNMLSYAMGTGILDKLDCKCQKRTSARKKVEPLLELIKDLNWQLVKFKPDNFYHAEDIENFKELLTENPQDVTHDMLLNMFRIVIELRGEAYDQLSRLISTKITMTPVIQRARDNLPQILSQDCTKITFSKEEAKEIKSGETQSISGAESPAVDELRRFPGYICSHFSSESVKDRELEVESPTVSSLDGLDLAISDTDRIANISQISYSDYIKNKDTRKNEEDNSSQGTSSSVDEDTKTNLKDSSKK